MALTSPATVGGGVARDITVGITKKSSNIRSKVIETVLVLCLLLSMVILLVLIVDLIWRSWSVWTERPVDFLTSGLNSQNAAAAGVWQGIKGTLILMVLVAARGVPVGHRVRRVPRGVLVAVTVREVDPDQRAQPRRRPLDRVRPARSGDLRQGPRRRSPAARRSSLPVSTLAALVLPIVIITASEALRAVPRSIREGALGVGATEWETVRHHVLPVRRAGHPDRHGPGARACGGRSRTDPPGRRGDGICSSPEARTSSSSSQARSRRCPPSSIPSLANRARISERSLRRPPSSCWCSSC